MCFMEVYDAECECVDHTSCESMCAISNAIQRRRKGICFNCVRTVPSSQVCKTMGSNIVHQDMSHTTCGRHSAFRLRSSVSRPEDANYRCKKFKLWPHVFIRTRAVFVSRITANRLLSTHTFDLWGPCVCV